jgi:hypothetical protein
MPYDAKVDCVIDSRILREVMILTVEDWLGRGLFREVGAMRLADPVNKAPLGVPLFC